MKTTNFSDDLDMSTDVEAHFCDLSKKWTNGPLYVSISPMASRDLSTTALKIISFFWTLCRKSHKLEK